MKPTSRQAGCNKPIDTFGATMLHYEKINQVKPMMEQGCWKPSESRWVVQTGGIQISLALLRYCIEL